MLNVKHLYYFHVFAQELNITEAAKRLKISAPALSNQLKELEGFLGFKLSERINGKTQITDFGATVVHYADRMFAAYEELKSRLPTTPDGKRKQFNVGICENIGARFSLNLLSLIAESQMTQAPEMEIHFHTTGELMTGFRAGDFDLVIGAFPAELDAEKLWTVQVIDFPVRLFAPPRLFDGVSAAERANLEANLDALIEHANARKIAVILPSKPAVLREETDRFLLNIKSFPARTIDCNNSSGIVGLIEAGYAMGFVPTPSLLDFKSGSLLTMLGPPGGYWSHGISVRGQKTSGEPIKKVSPLADIFHFMK